MKLKKITKWLYAPLANSLVWFKAGLAIAGNPLSENPFLDSAARGAGYNTDVDANTVLFEVLGKVIFAVVSMIGVLFILLIIYGGYTWMNARGDEAAVRKAKNIIRDAIIGLIVLATSYSIWVIFETLLGI